MRHIERAGYAAVGAADGPSALELIRRLAPSVLCVDLNLPGMSGIELVARARERHPGAMPPVVLMTASTDALVPERALAAGIDHVVRKPLGSRDIARLVLPHLAAAIR